jgi:hypothetical protein
MARIQVPLTERLQLSVKRAFATQAIEGEILGYIVWIITLGIQDEDQLRNRLRELVRFDAISDRYLAIVWAEIAGTSRKKEIGTTSDG